MKFRVITLNSSGVETRSKSYDTEEKAKHHLAFKIATTIDLQEGYVQQDWD